MQPEYFTNRLSCAFLLVLCLLTGCDNGSLVEPTTKPPYEGITLKIACADATAREVLATHGKVWAVTRGAKLEIVDRTFADVPDADIGIIAPAELGSYARAQTIAPVPEAIRHPTNAYHYDYLASIYREKLLPWNGVPMALPVLGEGVVLAYNKEKLRMLGVPPPETWEALEQLAAKIGPGALPPLPMDDATLDRDFFTVVATLQRPAMMASDAGARPQSEAEANRLFAFHYDLVTGEPRIATPAFVAALNWFQKVQPYRARDEQTQPVFRFATLREVAAMPKSANYGIASIPGAAKVYDFDSGKLVPTNAAINHVPYVGWGGTLGVVRKTSAHADAAWDLLTYLGASDTIGIEIIAAARFGAGPTRTSHLDGLNQKLWSSYPFDAADRDRLITALRQQIPAGLVNPVIRLRTEDQAVKTQMLVQALRQTIPGGDAEKALQGVVKAWNDVDAQLPIAERITRYRESLGLSR